METLTIGKLARAVHINLETVRYYERQGLLLKPPRSPAGYRVFPASAVARLRFIRRAQALGFSLREIKSLLATESCGQARRLLEVKLAAVRSKIEELQKLERQWAGSAARCVDAGGGRCPLLEVLNED